MDIRLCLEDLAVFLLTAMMHRVHYNVKFKGRAA